MKLLLRKLLPLMAVILFTAVPLSLLASEAPDIYLRGTFNGWKPTDEYKFQYSGNEYSIHVDRLDGHFKIADADWSYSYDYGARSSQETEIAGSSLVKAKRKGDNWNAIALENVDISFTLSDTEEIDIKIIVDGQEIPDPLKSAVSGTLPVLYINVYTDDTHSSYDNEIISKDLNHKNYFSFAEYRLDINGCEWMEELGAKSIGSEEEYLPLEIKARGNYTRTGFSKKPYKIKLGKKQNLLGLTPEKSKHYALLAHADDQYGYLRNFTGFNLGKRIGLPWTPSQHPLEVVINGDYRGLYFLTESIRIGDGRLMISELDDNETDIVLTSGGYLVELDNYDEENQIKFKEKPSSNGDQWVRVTFDTPEEYSDLQKRFISDQFNAINDRIADNNNELWSYLDLDDLARYYLVEEIISHTEAFHGSTYLFRDRGENQKWHFSPLWDCGNAFNGATDNYFFAGGTWGNTWIHTLIHNRKFLDKVKETWKWFMSEKFDGLYEDIDEYSSNIATAARFDRKRWKDAPTPNSSQATPVADNSDMEGRTKSAKSHISRKIEWLTKTFGSYEGYFTEPERDTTPAASLPDYLSAGSGITLTPDEDAELGTVYFNLQGIKVENPSAGIYIRRTGTKSEKVFIR